MRKLFAFIVDEQDDPKHVMVITHTGDGVINLQAQSAEEGKDLAGVTSNNLHDLYNRLFPDGWKIEWVKDTDNHEGFVKSMYLNRLKMLN